MYQTILDAMTSLGETGLIFGSENPQKGESDFQLALGDELSRITKSDGWIWRYGSFEERFKTMALKNKESIEVDLAGRHHENGVVAIELKFVPAPPKDRAAFPWDVAKDCLKLDLLRADRCTPAFKEPHKLQTFALAMSNWPNYWQGTGSLAWSTNFVNVMRKTPVIFDGLIKTTGGNPGNTIFRQGRCHIAFGRTWTGEWRPFGSTARMNQFRFLLLRPTQDAQPEWTHHEARGLDKQSEIYPFLTIDARNEWQKRRQALKESSIIRTK